jgi:hypothetical protein
VLALVAVVVTQSGRGPHATVSARRRNGRHLSGTPFRTLEVVIGEDGRSIQSELRPLPSVSQSHVQDPTEVQGSAVTIAAAAYEPHDPRADAVFMMPSWISRYDSDTRADVQ